MRFAFSSAREVVLLSETSTPLTLVFGMNTPDHTATPMP